MFSRPCWYALAGAASKVFRAPLKLKICWLFVSYYWVTMLQVEALQLRHQISWNRVAGTSAQALQLPATKSVSLHYFSARRHDRRHSNLSEVTGRPCGALFSSLPSLTNKQSLKAVEQEHLQRVKEVNVISMSALQDTSASGQGRAPEVTFYTHTLCPYAHRVALTLAEKGEPDKKQFVLHSSLRE
jgi:hypothetical protein